MLDDLQQSPLESRCPRRPRNILNASFRNTGNSFFRASNDGHDITARPELVLKCLSEMTINTINNPRVGILVQQRIHNYLTYNTSILIIYFFFKSLVNKYKTLLGKKNIHTYIHRDTAVFTHIRIHIPSTVFHLLHFA